MKTGLEKHLRYTYALSARSKPEVEAMNTADLMSFQFYALMGCRERSPRRLRKMQFFTNIVPHALRALVPHAWTVG